MKTLVTWTDRGPRAVRSVNRSRARGPVKTAILRTEIPYEHVLLLSTDEVLLGARELMNELKDLGVTVRLHRVDERATQSYEGLYEAMWTAISALGNVDVDGLISAGSPKARAAWLALAASGLFEGSLIQVQGESLHRIALPNLVSVPKPTAFGTLREAVSATEARMIRATLEHTGNNLSRTARVLDIDRNTLKRKMRQMGIQT